MKFIKVMASLFAFMLNATPGFPEEKSIIQVTSLTDNLYKFTIDAVSYTVNMVVYIGEDGTLLVDTGLKEAAEEMKEKIKSLGGDVPKYIINTHAHVDHTGGNAIYGSQPVIIAHNIVKTRLKSGRYVIDEYPDEALPDITFKDTMTLYFNGEEIRIIAIPGSHDDNDIIVHFTKSGIAVLGDLAYGMDFPSVDGLTGDVLKYGEVVKKAIDVLPDDVKVISGHGRDCTIDDMREFHNMLVQTTNIIRKELAKGSDLDELKEKNILKDWDSYGNGYVSADAWIKCLAEGIQNKPRKKSIFEPLYLALKEEDLNGVIKKYYELKEKHNDEYLFTDTRLYFFGYRLLLEKGRFQDAIKIFELNIKEYPTSTYTWVTYDGLGESYMKMGDKEEAIKNYNKSLELNPDNTQASDMLKELERK